MTLNDIGIVYTHLNEFNEHSHVPSQLFSWLDHSSHLVMQVNPSHVFVVILDYLRACTLDLPPLSILPRPSSHCFCIIITTVTTVIFTAVVSCSNWPWSWRRMDGAQSKDILPVLLSDGQHFLMKAKPVIISSFFQLDCLQLVCWEPFVISHGPTSIQSNILQCQKRIGLETLGWAGTNLFHLKQAIRAV